MIVQRILIAAPSCRVLREFLSAQPLSATRGHSPCRGPRKQSPQPRLSWRRHRQKIPSPRPQFLHGGRDCAPGESRPLNPPPPPPAIKIKYHDSILFLALI